MDCEWCDPQNPPGGYAHDCNYHKCLLIHQIFDRSVEKKKIKPTACPGVTNFLQHAAKLVLQAVVYVTANPSVCLSVCHTPVLCQNEGMQRWMRSSPAGNPMSLVFWCKEWLLGRPCPGKIWVQRGWPPVKTSKLYTFLLITPQR